MARRMRCELSTWDEVYDLSRTLAFRVAEAARPLEDAYGMRVPDRTLEDVFRLWPGGVEE